jgi:polygalacturonase
MKQLIVFVLALDFTLGVTFAAERSSYNVLDFGAKGDGVTKDTVALQAALDACATGGGGTVMVPDGVYLTGSLVIRSNTTLQLASRADILGSPDIADYPVDNIRFEGEFRDGHRALISANNAANITISGGAIFGPPITLAKYRNPRGPVLIELTGCTNALLENFTSQYQQLWSIHVLFCKDFTARNLTIRTVMSNGDGIDVDSCDGVIVDHCDIDTGDDAISLKSGRGLAAQNMQRPTQNVYIHNCRLQSSIYAALGLGTEISGGLRNVKIENCIIAGRQNAIYIKSREGRGGFMENISGENLTVLKSPTFIGIDLLHKGIQASDPVPGDVDKWSHVGNLSFKNIHLQDVTQLIEATNVPLARPLDGFTLSGISGTCTRGISLANMTNVLLSEIKVTGYTGKLITLENVSGKGLEESASRKPAAAASVIHPVN